MSALSSLRPTRQLSRAFRTPVLSTAARGTLGQRARNCQTPNDREREKRGVVAVQVKAGKRKRKRRRRGRWPCCLIRRRRRVLWLGIIGVWWPRPRFLYSLVYFSGPAARVCVARSCDRNPAAFLSPLQRRRHCERGICMYVYKKRERARVTSQGPPSLSSS